MRRILLATCALAALALAGCGDNATDNQPAPVPPLPVPTTTPAVTPEPAGMAAEIPPAVAVTPPAPIEGIGMAAEVPPPAVESPGMAAPAPAPVESPGMAASAPAPVESPGMAASAPAPVESPGMAAAAPAAATLTIDDVSGHWAPAGSCEAPPVQIAAVSVTGSSGICDVRSAGSDGSTLTVQLACGANSETWTIAALGPERPADRINISRPTGASDFVRCAPEDSDE